MIEVAVALLGIWTVFFTWYAMDRMDSLSQSIDHLKRCIDIVAETGRIMDARIDLREVK